jgi:hypothetical protein
MHRSNKRYAACGIPLIVPGCRLCRISQARNSSSGNRPSPPSTRENESNEAVASYSVPFSYRYTASASDEFRVRVGTTAI